MKTKEEIIKKHSVLNPLINLNDTASLLMDEWAKQEAIEFAGWIAGYESKLMAKRHFNVKTDEQIYEIYQQSKNKTT